MKKNSRRALSILAASAAVLLAGACGGNDAEKLVGSARDFLAKKDAKAAVIQLKNALNANPASPEARFLLGKALFESGDPAGAEVELRKALDARYATDQVVPMLAKVLVATGQAKKAVADYASAELSTAEGKAELQTALTQAYGLLGQADKAKAALASALAAKADYVPALVIQAKVSAGEGDEAAARRYLDSALAHEPDNAEALKVLGDMLFAKGETEPAVASYRKAIAAQADFGPAHSSLIAVLIRQGKLDEAGAQVESMKKALPKNIQTLRMEADYLYRKRDMTAAREAIQELLRFTPNEPTALSLAGAIHFDLNALPQAEEYLARAVKLVPSNLLARRLLASTYLRLGQPAKALETVEPVLREIGNNANFMALVGQIYMVNGKPKLAEEYFAKAAALDPKDPAKQTAVALTHMAEGRLEAGFNELESIAASDTGSKADMALFATALKQRDFARALKAVDGLEKKQPGSPAPHALRGTVLAAKGDIPGARKSLDKALALKPDFLPAAASLAALDLKDNKPDAAKGRFQSVIAADPKNVRAILALAELKARTGAGSDEVAGDIGKAIQVAPTNPGPRLALIGWHLKDKQFKKAIGVAQDAMAAMPDRPDIVTALGRAYQAAGESNQALATYGKLVALMPGSPQPQLLMAEAHLATKNFDAAIQSLRKALDIKPDLIGAQKGLIQLYLSRDNVGEANAVVKEVKNQRPKEAFGYALEGDVAAYRKAWKDAANAYRAGLKLTPASELATKYYLAQQMDNNGVEAEKFATTWLSEHPTDTAFRLSVADNAINRKDVPKAIKQYQYLLQSQPNNAVVLNNMAWALGQINDPRAMEYAEKANALVPNQPAIMETLGGLLLQKGDTARATDILKKSLELAPQAPEIKLSLARAQIKAGNRDEARRLLQELGALGDKFAQQGEVATLMKGL